jgi:non-canonical (house-cleaning) NTP pyrophosphatase
MEKMELGNADDALFNRVISKQGEGTLLGVLTRSMIDSAGYYGQAMKLAAIPFLWPDHYFTKK